MRVPRCRSPPRYVSRGLDLTVNRPLPLLTPAGVISPEGSGEYGATARSREESTSVSGRLPPVTAAGGYRRGRLPPSYRLRLEESGGVGPPQHRDRAHADRPRRQRDDDVDNVGGGDDLPAGQRVDRLVDLEGRDR